MEGLLKVFMDMSKAFYLGKDDEGWSLFGRALDRVEKVLEDKDTSEIAKIVLLDFVKNIESFDVYKQQNNYTVIGDILFATYNGLISNEEIS